MPQKSGREKKHGVHISDTGQWNTKTIYNHGHVMRVYRRQPKVVRFQSPMVNDTNQHLCGGWTFSDIGEEKDFTIQQLLNTRKPFASISFWPRDCEEAKQSLSRLHEAGLPAVLKEQIKPVKVLRLNACQNMRVCGIGSMDALKLDYSGNIGPEIASEIDAYANKHLSEFFDEWDSPPLPLWLTGLILGYPIENTISLYRQ